MTGARVTGRAVAAALDSWDVEVTVCDDDADPTAVLTGAAAVLRERFAIDHATIQVEPRSAHACVETSW